MTETVWEVSSVGELAAVAGELIGVWKNQGSSDTATVVALSGDLGAGKTTFVQQVATALGVSDTVSSPTFVIMKMYETEDTVFSALVHIDAYRIDGVSEMTPLGFSKILSQPNTLVCIEWAEKISELLPVDTIHISLESMPHSVHKITHHGA